MTPTELEQIRTGYTRSTARPGWGVAQRLLAHIDELDARIAELERLLRAMGQQRMEGT